ncbi:conserved hypothetical protein [Chloroherpeton thalassium ATCC 35110]|uniref:DUF3593 domain-containing protein n=1 Tax=Chloroherpeton thalassium (strain ATCC 35110 / GB-78) TaxID=517418 RepID=B3QVL9_CHLT3|nr:DUF2499 domain-containing protein [Chloroherpeton thalassium]ACF13076.1 conserved hypothetical protein [Chloroherpeton thalassium ATCC 35110]
MLLSIPTWIVHISSMAEWGMAIFLLYRYGKIIHRSDVRQFALLMIPHWAGGLCVLAFHTTGDSVSFLLDASKVINFFGSTSLLYASLQIIKQAKKLSSAAYAALFLLLPLLGNDKALQDLIINGIFQLSSMIYLAFLVSLLFLYRQDKTVFSKLTIFGFWFVLFFVSFTLVCMYFAIHVRGYATLSHDDLLHGLAESFLSISNLMIVLGIQQKLKEAKAIRLL